MIESDNNILIGILCKVKLSVSEKQEKRYLLYEHLCFQDEPTCFLDEAHFLLFFNG